MPRSSCFALSLSLESSGELRQRAAHLRQQSRFLHRQSDRLRSRSNDLLTIAMFRQERMRRCPEAGRRLLALVS